MKRHRVIATTTVTRSITDYGTADDGLSRRVEVLAQQGIPHKVIGQRVIFDDGSGETEVEFVDESV